ncbi:hypothetical protein U9M48_026920 [Paspalum notatum var. saurae]|uniref:Uncharacterized protein n=1 Tax=Paspalum notatum var. saurae TaxID=547442 RepID=A0AAQ3TTR0_PASNO
MPRLEGGGGAPVALVATSGGGIARPPPPSLWRTPTPYLFLAFAFLMGLIAVALIVLFCTRRKPSRRGAEDDDDEAEKRAAVLAPLDREVPKVVVFMPGDRQAPSSKTQRRQRVREAGKKQGEMRPERSGGVPAGAAELMAGGGGAAAARPGLWRTPTPYLFLGFASMMGLIVVALLVLICTRRKASSSPSRRGAAAAAAEASVRVLVPLDREPKVVVIMAGDALPSFLASAKPLAAFADAAATLGANAGAAAAV